MIEFEKWVNMAFCDPQANARMESNIKSLKLLKGSPNSPKKFETPKMAMRRNNRLRVHKI